MTTALLQLKAALHLVDVMTVEAEIMNDRLRVAERGYTADKTRLERYGKQRETLRDMRRALIALYQTATGEPFVDEGVVL